MRAFKFGAPSQDPHKFCAEVADIIFVRARTRSAKKYSGHHIKIWPSEFPVITPRLSLRDACGNIADVTDSSGYHLASVRIGPGAGRMTP
jgi:hypothetical protein